MNAGRPRSFDEDDALKTVMDVFWREGFDGTNFEQLVNETGLSRSSLYNTFGGKEVLFQRSLDLYVDQEFENFVSNFFSTDKPDALRSFIRYLAEPYDPDSKGCLIQKTLMENATAGGQPKQEKTVVRILNKYWGIFTDVFERAVRRKKTKPITNREKGAMCLAIVLGIAVIARNGRNQDLVEAVSSGAEKIIDLER